MVARGRGSSQASRNPAARRHHRGDRDGDVSMDVAGKGRGRVGKSASSSLSAKKELLGRPSRGGKTALLSNASKGAILKHMGSGDVSMRGARSHGSKSGEVELKVTGWEHSKASFDPDGGVGSLIQWLEKKSSQKLGSKKTNVKLNKTRLEVNTLFVYVPPEEVGALLRLDGWGWAGKKVRIERVGGPAQGESASTADTKALLRGVLERRYNLDSKLLDLSALHLDEALQAKHVFDTKSTTGKVFPAMMRVLELCFDTPEERHAAIESVSLANNDLADLAMVTTLSQTLPKLLNLDLSNNKFSNLSSLQAWRRRFHSMQQLILSGNPIEQNEPNYPAEVMKWFPNLRTLNGIQVRTEEEIAQKPRVTDLTFPIRGPLFQDEGGIAENFVRTFFMGYDTDRAQLAEHYYDDQSDFSMAVNTQAPRDPNNTAQTEKQDWEHYIKRSRNLKKITQLPARQSRLYRGVKPIAEAFADMPKTRHPDLATEPAKWMVEAHIQPGVPDTTGQSPNGVDGFMITVHGEFDEVDNSVQSKKKRSFDRTFIIGPGGSSGVRIVNDLLTLRAYGGPQAFEPDDAGATTDANVQALTNPDAPPELPAGLTIEMAEQMVTELQKQTNMTLQYSKDCLDQVGWDYQKALEAFATVKGNLPQDAFMQVT